MERNVTEFLDLPEGCVSTILSLTTPRDACRSAATSTMFRSATEADTVWEKFLPSDYEEILNKSSSTLQFSSKKELYFRLCDSILLDGGTKSFWLNKTSGKKCYMVGARQLSISWGDTDRYWEWKSTRESRFAEVAHLKIVWWLDINGSIDTRSLSPQTTYAAFIIVKFVNSQYDLGPVEVSVQVGDYISRSTALLSLVNRQISMWHALPLDVEVGVPRDGRADRVPRDGRPDGWMEVELGDFYNNDGDDGEVTMNMHNHNCYYIKRGLIIEGIELRPKQ